MRYDEFDRWFRCEQRREPLAEADPVFWVVHRQHLVVAPHGRRARAEMSRPQRPGGLLEIVAGEQGGAALAEVQDAILGGALSAHVYNGILWGNEAADLSIAGNIMFAVHHSDVGGVEAIVGATYSPGMGIIDVDPRFVSVTTGDFHRRGSSPLVDLGAPEGIPITDFEGDPRTGGPLPDPGADEIDPVIFGDGFESGDTSKWSSTVP